MSSSKSEKSSSIDENPKILLLESFYGDYYTPVVWEPGKKNKNYFARISPGTKFPFARKFLQNLTLDNNIVYKGSDFPEEEIIEQKAVFIKGTKQEVVFHGFFIIHHGSEGIYGKEISQKEALQYFDFQKQLPDLNENQNNAAINQLKMKLGTVVRKYAAKYGEETMVKILTMIIEEYFPN